jgi:GAF domain-containing protein
VNPPDPNLAKRLSALEEYQIMDTLPEEMFDDLTFLASSICKTPISLISLLDEKRQWFKSRYGITAKETPIEQAFCAHAVLEPQVFVVTDTTKDARFAQNPLVTSAPNIRFYAGAPLITPDGVPLGTLCAIDDKVRNFSSGQAEALAALGRQVITQMELRRTTRRLENSLAQTQKVLEEVRQLQTLLPICSYCKMVRDDDNYWHQVDHYLAAKAEVAFSHCICPECFPKVMAEVEELQSSMNRENFTN